MPTPILPVKPFDPLGDIAEFHEKFGLGYSGPPRQLEPEMAKLRITQIIEEGVELTNAKSDEEKFDAMIDQVYFIIGTAYLHGWNWREGWRRVHEKNMQKVRAKSDGADSKRKSGFDVVKPPGWTPPDLSDLVKIPESPEDVFSDETWAELEARINYALTHIMLKDGTPGFPASRNVITKQGMPLVERFYKGERTPQLREAMEAFIENELMLKLKLSDNKVNE